SSHAPLLNVSSRADLPDLTGIFKISTGEDFLKWDSGVEDDRILLFGTDATLDCLQRSEHWFADGTFKLQPLIFDQLYTIHALQTDGENLLCSNSLLPHPQQDYKDLYEDFRKT